MTELDHRGRWLALFVLCSGSLMIVLDSTIVNVALPSIREDLGFSESSLAWVVNAYLLTFGGFLLLGGRLGDLFGHRRLFIAGLSLFTVASLACGLAGSQTFLIAARAVQGLGGAVVSVVAFSLVMMLFTEPAERTKAMGVIGFVAAGGGSVGVLAGGVLTDLLNWHWIFLVNIPVGAASSPRRSCCSPVVRGLGAAKVDVTGAVTVTAALMIAVYAIVNGNTVGWGSAADARHARREPGPPRRLRGRRGALGRPARAAVALQAAAASPSPTSSVSCGPPRCSPGSSCRRSTCSWCWATARWRSGSRSCRPT